MSRIQTKYKLKNARLREVICLNFEFYFSPNTSTRVRSATVAGYGK